MAPYVEQDEKEVDAPGARQKAGRGFKSWLLQCRTACDLGTVGKLLGQGERYGNGRKLCIFYLFAVCKCVSLRTSIVCTGPPPPVSFLSPFRKEQV